MMGQLFTKGRGGRVILHSPPPLNETLLNTILSPFSFFANLVDFFSYMHVNICMLTFVLVGLENTTDCH